MGGFQGRGPEEELQCSATTQDCVCQADLKLMLVHSHKYVAGWHTGRDHSGTCAAAILPARGQPAHIPFPLQLPLLPQHKGLPLLSKKKWEDTPGPQPGAPLLHANFCGFSLASSYFTWSVTCCGQGEKSPPNTEYKPAPPNPQTPACSLLGSQLFFLFLKQHNLHVVLFGTSLPSH